MRWPGSPDWVPSTGASAAVRVANAGHHGDAAALEFVGSVGSPGRRTRTGTPAHLASARTRSTGSVHACGARLTAPSAPAP